MSKWPKKVVHYKGWAYE